jgi:hypothetical protein
LGSPRLISCHVEYVTLAELVSYEHVIDRRAADPDALLRRHPSPEVILLQYIHLISPSHCKSPWRPYLRLSPRFYPVNKTTPLVALRYLFSLGPGDPGLLSFTTTSLDVPFFWIIIKQYTPHHHLTISLNVSKTILDTVRDPFSHIPAFLVSGNLEHSQVKNYLQRVTYKRCQQHDYSDTTKRQ